MSAARRTSQRLAYSAVATAPTPAAPAPPAKPSRSSSSLLKKTKKAAAVTSDESLLSASVDDDSSTEPPSSSGLRRCWNTSNADSIRYHDKQWGHPAYFFPPSLDPSTLQYRRCINRLFQLQTLELMQAGISWQVVFKKWDGFERAFAHFDVATVAAWGEREVERLLQDEGIVRNRLKVLAVISNAQVIQRMETERPNSFLLLLLAYHIHPPTPPPSSSSPTPCYHLIHPQERTLATGQHQSSWMRSDYTTPALAREVSDGVHPSRTVAHLSRRLKEEGFRFMGETVVLSWLQAVGLMNHHAVTCPEFEKAEKEWAELVRMVQREVGTRTGCCGWLAREEEVRLNKTGATGAKRARKGKQVKAAVAEESEEKADEPEAEARAEETQVQDEEKEKEDGSSSSSSHHGRRSRRKRA